jgi:predicted RNA-binding Zn-ribbon protein involved in translation (DUF1610 family)
MRGITQAMAMVAVKCPSCGGTVQIEEGMSSAFCIHCGGKIVNEKKNGGQAPAEKDSPIIRDLKMAKESLAEHDWDAVRGVVENILRDNADCQDAWYMKALLHRREKTFDSIIANAESGGMKDHGVFSKEDISKSWGECELIVTFEFSKRVMINMKARVTVDGKESFVLERGESTVFGVDTGKHEIFVCFVIKAGDTAGDRLSFIATKEHEFVIKTASTGMMILNHTPKVVQLR